MDYKNCNLDEKKFPSTEDFSEAQLNAYLKQSCDLAIKTVADMQELVDELLADGEKLKSDPALEVKFKMLVWFIKQTGTIIWPLYMQFKDNYDQKTNESFCHSVGVMMHAVEKTLQKKDK